MFNLIIGGFIFLTISLLLGIPFIFVLFIEKSFLNSINNDLKDIKKNLK